MIIVVLDLLMVILYWLSLLCIRPFVELTNDEVIQNNLSAPDFTVIVRNDLEGITVKDFAPIMWDWAENVLLKSEAPPSIDDITMSIDQNQNKIINVHLALDSYGFVR
jgi:hypothetical protein